MMIADAHLPKAQGQNQNQVLSDAIGRLYRGQAYTPLQKIFAKTMPADLAVVLESFSEDHLSNIFALVNPPSTAAKVLKELSSKSQILILNELETGIIVPILEKLAPDARTDLISQLEGELANRLMNALAKDSRIEVENLLQYDPNTAGGLMTSELFALPEDTLVASAMEAVRGLSNCEMVTYLYVVDNKGRLCGVSSLRQLLLAHPQKTLAQMMDTRIVKASANTPAEEVAEMAQRHRLLGVPVVDENGLLIGMVTVDDLIEVMEKEVTGDIFKMAGTNSLELLFHSPFDVFKIRFPWLFTAFLGGVGAVYILDNFADTLQTVISLCAFLPVVMGIAGNVGTQAATVAMRGLSIGAIKISDYWPILFKEIRVGLFLGAFYGLCLGIVAWFIFHDTRLVATLGGTILLNLTLAAVIASSLPFFFKKMGTDRALSSGPFVLSAIDLLAVINYLTIASLVYDG